MKLDQRGKEGRYSKFRFKEIISWRQFSMFVHIYFFFIVPVCVWECVLVHKCVGREKSWQRRWFDLTWLRLIKDTPGLCGFQCKPTRSNPHPFSFHHSFCLSILSSVSSQHTNVHFYLLSSLFAQSFSFEPFFGIISRSLSIFIESGIFMLFSLIFSVSVFSVICLMPLQWSLSVS